MLHTRITHVSTPRGIIFLRNPERQPLRNPLFNLFRTNNRYNGFSTYNETATDTALPKKNSSTSGTSPVGLSIPIQSWGVNKLLVEATRSDLRTGLEGSGADVVGKPPPKECSPLNQEVLSPLDNPPLESPVPGPWSLLEAQEDKPHTRKTTLSIYLLGTTRNARDRAVVELTGSPKNIEMPSAADDERLVQDWSTLSVESKKMLLPSFIRHTLLRHPGRLHKVISETLGPQCVNDSLLRSLMRFLYYHYLSEKHLAWTRPLQDVSPIPMEPFYKTLLDIVPHLEDPNSLLEHLPRYYLVQNCPSHLSDALQTLLNKCSSQRHWEHYLHSACAHAEKGDAESAVYAIKDAIISHADTSSVEFYNAIRTVLEPSRPYDDTARATSQIISKLIPALKTPWKLHPLIYTLLCEQALAVGDIQLIVSVWRFQLRCGVTIYPRTLVCLLRGLENCEDETLLTSVTEFVNNYALRRRNRPVGNRAIYCWLKYHNRRGSSSLYKDILPHYLKVFDPRALAELGLQYSVPNLETSPRPKMQPNNCTLTIMLHAFLIDNRDNPSALRIVYRSFQQAIRQRSGPILKALKAGPSLYNIFLLAFSRLPNAEHLQDCMTVMADVSTELPANTLPTDPATYAHIVLAGPDIWTWRLLLRAFGHFRQFAAAEKVLAEIRRRWGAKSAASGAHSLMSAYSGAQNVQGAMDIFQQLIKEDLLVPEYSLMALGKLRNRDELSRMWLDEDSVDEREAL